MDPLSIWAIALVASMASIADTNGAACPSRIEADKIKGMSVRGKDEQTYRLIEESAVKLANHTESGPEIVAFLLGVAFALDPLGRVVRPKLAQAAGGNERANEKLLEEAFEEEVDSGGHDVQVASRITLFLSRGLSDVPGNSYRLIDFVSGMKASRPEEMSAASKEGLEWGKLKKFLSFKIHANAIDSGSFLKKIRRDREQAESLLPPDPYEEEYGGKELSEKNREQYGLLRGTQNPANWLIEAYRRESGSLVPSREMLLTYWDNEDPGIISECARIVAEMAKSSGMKLSDYKESLRKGMNDWYKPNPSIASGPVRGSVSFSS